MRAALVLILWTAQAVADEPRFRDATQEAGLSFRLEASATPRKYLPETMLGGVALLDYDRDGLLDAFFVNGAELEFPHPPDSEPSKAAARYWNRLYRNQGDGTFADVTEKTGVQGRGYGMGVAVGDVNNDGYPDLAVTNFAVGESPALLLYVNVGGERFEERAEQTGIDARGWATSAAFLDYDSDGDLDLFVDRYMEWRFNQDLRCGMETAYGRTFCHPDLFPPISSLLYRNEGDGRFRDVSVETGVAEHLGKALGVAVADFNGDGLPDVVVANDSHPQFLFVNQGDGTFEEDGLFSGIAYDEDGEEFAGMGVAAADLDGDQRTDLVMTTLSPQKYAVYFNRGEEGFDYAATESGIGRATQFSSGWGAGAYDFDNDGLRDLFFANSHVMDNIEQSQPHLRYREPPMLLVQSNGKFSAFETGLPTRAGRGAAFGDVDNDGDVDVLISNLDGPPTLALNTTTSGNWITVDLASCRGTPVGAKVELEDSAGRRQTATAGVGGSYLSSSDHRIHFGLGTSEAKTIRVEWSDRELQEVATPPTNRILSLRRGCAAP